MRKYKSGTGWCVWRWTDVPTEYIRRLHVLKCPWFAVCVHWLNGPDPEPWLHDHPVSFLSLILRGQYREWVPSGLTTTSVKSKLNRWFRWFNATDAHSIWNVEPGTVTLCFMGPKVIEWGYHTDKGWVHWKEYNQQKYPKCQICGDPIPADGGIQACGRCIVENY